MNQFENLMLLLKQESPDVFLLIEGGDGLFTAIDLPIRRAIEVYETRANIKGEMEDIDKVGQLKIIVDNLKKSNDSSVKLFSFYFEKFSYIVFTSQSIDILFGVYESQTNIAKLTEVQESSFAIGNQSSQTTRFSKGQIC
jgi:hypothetical protein